MKTTLKNKIKGNSSVTSPSKAIEATWSDWYTVGAVDTGEISFTRYMLMLMTNGGFVLPMGFGAFIMAILAMSGVEAVFYIGIAIGLIIMTPLMLAMEYHSDKHMAEYYHFSKERILSSPSYIDNPDKGWLYHCKEDEQDVPETMAHVWINRPNAKDNDGIGYDTHAVHFDGTNFISLIFEVSDSRALIRHRVLSSERASSDTMTAAKRAVELRVAAENREEQSKAASGFFHPAETNTKAFDNAVNAVDQSSRNHLIQQALNG